MIRRGKAEGWPSTTPEAFRPWAQLNGVSFHEVKPGSIEGRGAALLASKAVSNSAEGAECLLTIPKDLILSRERVADHAKIDRDFREVLESIGDFGRTPRGAILTFLLLQVSTACPDLSERVGVHGPFTDYVKSLPPELLPTSYTSSELNLLHGTTLHPATTSKLRSLRREYDHLITSCSQTRWFKLVKPYLDFSDWLAVDAMYRSRALEYPSIGHCMVPVLDLANHCSGEGTVATYDADSEGNAILLLRQGHELKEGDEVTITYGDEKGACEMLFSYGFLEDGMKTAETLFLGLTIADSDPMRAAKMQIADCAPGVKIVDAGDGEIDWKGDFIWLLCITAEDGFHVDIARTVDGGEELQAFLDGQELKGAAAELYRVLGKSKMWDVYRLRAVTVLQQRVFEQLQVLFGSQEGVEEVERGDGTDVREKVFAQAMELRKLEFELLERAYEDFERQKLELVESEVVQKYLASMNSGDDAAEEDFS